MFDNDGFHYLSDVVYDTTVIPSLVLVLKKLLSVTLENGEKPVAYVASTVRLEDTRDQFLFTLGNGSIFS